MATDAYSWLDRVTMAPGQIPYSPQEMNQLRQLVRLAAEHDPGELNEPDLCRCRRHYVGAPCPEGS